MYNLNAVSISSDTVSKTRVNRTNEINRIRLTIEKKSENVFLFGERGVGKSFLLKMLIEDMHKSKSDTFPILFHLDQLLAMHSGDFSDAEHFPTILALKLVTSAWRAILNYPYQDLEKTVEYRRNQISSNKTFADMLQHFHSRMYASQSQSSYQRDSTLGASAVVKGEMKEQFRRESQSAGIIGPEIYELIQEIQRVLLDDFGFKKIAVLCDEANTLSEYWQKKLLSEHLNLFSDLGINFVFVAGYFPIIENIEIPNYFDQTIELEGLSSQEIAELISFNIDISRFDQDAVDTLTAYGKGNPRTILSIAWDCTLNNQHSNSISKQVVEEAIKLAEEKKAALFSSLKRE